MKLFLTSGGITNDTLAKSLFELVGKPAEQLKLAFIPTAANLEDEDKGWLIDDLMNFKKQDFQKIDIIDIAALEEQQWKPRLEAADILVFGGGDSEYLVSIIEKSGLSALLSDLLKNKVLVGISAGSVMCGPSINPEGSRGLGLIDFLFVPHMGSPFFKRTDEDVTKYAESAHKIVYWLDDNSAIAINDEKITVVGTGEHTIYNFES